MNMSIASSSSSERLALASFSPSCGAGWKSIGGESQSFHRFQGKMKSRGKKISLTWPADVQEVDHARGRALRFEARTRIKGMGSKERRAERFCGMGLTVLKPGYHYSISCFETHRPESTALTALAISIVSQA